MLTSIHLDGYRAFCTFKVRNLSRVNLFVGRNNCGKSSILEAIYILASAGDPDVLARIAWTRGEVVFFAEVSERASRDAFPDLSHFFHGHVFRPGVAFSVGSENGWGVVRVRVSEIEKGSEQLTLFETRPRRFDERGRPGIAFALVIDGGSNTEGEKPIAFPVSEEGALDYEPFPRFRRSARPTVSPRARVQFISPDSLLPESMSELWDEVVQRKREAEVVAALNILEPSLVDVVFLSSGRAFRLGGRAGVVVGLNDSPSRLPLGSFGDGMRRLLALALSLTRTDGGILLIDEIDTGLHWSVMGDMWRLVVEAARRSDVQVFATTHSSDCIRGLAWLCEKHPELATDVSVQKIDRNLDESVALDANEILIAYRQDIEIR